MRNYKKVVICLTMVLLVGLDSFGSNAAAMSSFPMQSTSSYSVKYTRAIQVMLYYYTTTTRSKIVSAGGIDGKYGNGTKNGVDEFQRLTGLTRDGICGSKTWSKFKTKLTANGSSGGFAYYKGNISAGVNIMKHSTNQSMNWSAYNNGKWYAVD